MSKCPTCGKTVYFAEKQTALGKDFHKLCFKCTTCGKKLEPGNFADRDDKLYCKGCYSRTKGGAAGFATWSGASGVSGKYGVDESHKEGQVNIGGANADKCPSCQAALVPGNAFCGQCGGKITA